MSSVRTASRSSKLPTFWLEAGLEAGVAADSGDIEAADALRNSGATRLPTYWFGLLVLDGVEIGVDKVEVVVFLMTGPFLLLKSIMMDWRTTK